MIFDYFTANLFPPFQENYIGLSFALETVKDSDEVLQKRLIETASGNEPI